MPYKDIEKQRVYCREYYKKRYATDPEFRAKQDKRDKKRFARMRIEAPWLFHWEAARQRCTNPSCINYKWYGGKGIRMLLTKLEIELLYRRDHADEMKRPSIDRINPNGDYHLGNCRFLELSENCRRINSY